MSHNEEKEEKSLLSPVNGDSNSNYSEKDITVLDKRTKAIRLLKTGALTLLWITMGLQKNIISPTLIDIRETVGCEHTYEEVSHALVVRGIFMFIGSFTGGFLVDRFRQHLDLFLGLWILAYGAALVLTPWMTSIPLLALALGIIGFMQGCVSVGGNTLIMSMWGQGSATAIQFLHAWYGVGMTVAPLLTAPFMSTTHCEQRNNHTNISSGNQSVPASQTHIQIPYAICGGVGVLGGVIYILIFLLKLRVTVVKSTVKNRKWTELFSPASCAEGKLCFGTMTMLLLFFIYCSMVGKDISITAFMEPLVVDYANFTKTEGAFLLTSYSVAYAVSRFIAAAVAIFVSLNILIFADIIGNLGAAIAIVTIPLQKKWHLWAFVSLFGFFAGPFYPFGVAWADQYIEITALGMAVVDFGISTGAALWPWFYGYLFSYIGPMYMLYFGVACNTALLILVCILQVVGSCNGQRKLKT